ncbi:hypothetical protein OOZ15_19475 [Galbibacter sp. EGI 63066]|uniref:hypothetical protein n=1 Tax=Galbibacter sp. EGI 63066 TaxID=2993559 RepID=UPI0022490D4F|nr:hypothetical protein [Galbibacter sp. EGI 63066]MCX2682136.1 hypothetical protein [Galbibacter sp. EGI 63066]
MVSIKQHSNLINTYFYWNAWNTDESFNLSELNNSQKEKLEEIEVIEILFEAESEGEDLFSPYENFLRDYFMKSENSSYLFVCELCQKQKTKLRSYKGFIKKEFKLSSDFCFELEVDLLEGYSMFGILIELNQDTIHTVSKFFLSNTSSFIINFGKTIKNKELFIRKVINDYVINHSNSSYIDYAKLTLDFCSERCVVYRTGGDGGSSEISLQAFSKPETKDLILLQAEMIV